MNEVPLSEVPLEMLERLAIRCDGYAYFSRDKFIPSWQPAGVEPPHPDVIRVMAAVLPRLVAAFELTSSPRIWRLAGDFSNYLVFYSGALDSQGAPDWKRMPGAQDHLELIDCLGGVIRMGVLGQHKPWIEWAMRGIYHTLNSADNDLGWPSQSMSSKTTDERFTDQGAREGLTFLRAVSCDATLWDPIVRRYLNPPQLVNPNLPVDPFRQSLEREAPPQTVLKKEHENIQVNLWLPYQDEQITIESGMPGESWLTIEAPSSAHVSLRVPDWLSLQTVRINDAQVSEVLLKLQPGFIDLPIPMESQARSLWKIDFGVPSATRDFRIPPTNYKAVWKGPYLMRLTSAERSAAVFERPVTPKTPSSLPASPSQDGKKPISVETRKGAAETARLTVVSITEAPIYSTQEMLLYLSKCMLRSGLKKNLPHTVTTTAGDVERMFGGRWPDMTPCTLPYHDLKHVWIVTAALGDLLQGMYKGGLKFDSQHFEFASIAMLLHGVGALMPAASNRRHYELSAEFSAAYVSRFGLAFGPKTQELIRNLILCTGFDAQVDMNKFPSHLWQQVGQAMGTAKLLGQMASADYLDRLPDLFEEISTMQLEGPKEGQPRNIQDLPSYFKNFVLKSLHEKYGMVYMYYQFLTADRVQNPYLQSAEKHLRQLEKAKEKVPLPTPQQKKKVG